MKRCGTCGDSFDDALVSCPVDGATLITDAADSPPADATFNSESSRRTPTTQYSDLLGKPTVSASQDQIPELQQYLASQTQPGQPDRPRQRKAWPWIVAVLVIVFLVIAVIIGIAAMISAR